MVFIQRIREGLRLIKESFIFLWEYKFLLLYPALAMIIFAVGQLLFSETFKIWTFGFLPAEHFVGYLTDSSRYGYLLLLFFLQGFIVTFFSVALAHHALRLIHRQITSSGEVVRSTVARLIPIVLWAIILVVFTITQRTVSMYRETLLENSFSMLGLMFNSLQIIFVLWILFTCYVIPIIALEHMNILKAIKLSCRLAKKTWLELMTGFGIYLLLTIILVVPAILWLNGLGYITALVLNIMLLWPLQCIGSTLSTLFVTIAYHHFYKQPMEDVEILRYPEF